MASTTTYHKSEWDTLHKNGPFPLKQLLVTKLAGKTHLPETIDRYNDAAQEIQVLIKSAKEDGNGFRAYGSRWSMSNVAHHPDRMHFNGFMNIDLPIFETDVTAGSSYLHENLFFFECGNTIKEISQVLEAHGKSLKTSGASNGQTIAGCIGTGVHGSALGVGAIQDYVVGLNLIVGPNPEDIIYLERASKPALKDAFAQRIKARVIRDDEMFDAALVGLGSFGFIHGVLIEAEDRFLLKRYVRKIDKQVAIALSETMDFQSSSFKIPNEIDVQGKPLQPYHYKVFINPYVDDDQYVIEVMYKKPYTTPYPDPFTTIETSIYRDLIYLLIKVSQGFPKAIPWFIKRLEKAILPDVNEESLGTLYETFWDAPYQGPAFACAFGVPHTEAGKTLNVLMNITKNKGPIPGIFAMRFVKQSTATLAFTKFPVTCVIEIDGVLWKETNNLIGLKKYSRLMTQALKQEQISFTMHWGKNADWGVPNLVNDMFGDKATIWKQQREKLLSPDMQELFSNDFTKTTGLSKSDVPFVEDPEPPIV